MASVSLDGVGSLGGRGANQRADTRSGKLTLGLGWLARFKYMDAILLATARRITKSELDSVGQRVVFCRDGGSVGRFGDVRGWDRVLRWIQVPLRRNRRGAPHPPTTYCEQERHLTVPVGRDFSATSLGP